MPERSECPDCGNEVAVNKDGSLRKHPCAEPVAPVEAAPVEQPEPVEPAPVEPVPRPRRRGCYVEPCRRPEVADGIGLCGAHYALRPDLRKVARHA